MCIRDRNGKVLFCSIFNIHPVVPAAVFALVMDIIAVDRPVTDFLMNAAQAEEIGDVYKRQVLQWSRKKRQNLIPLYSTTAACCCMSCTVK